MVYSLLDPNGALEFWIKTLIVSITSMQPSKPRELSRKGNSNGYQLNSKKQFISAIN